MDDVTENVTDNVTDDVTDRLTEIIKNIRSNPSISASELAHNTKVSKRTILRDFEKLKALGRIIRIGSEKTGHWQIIDDK